jgi:hypothetical protein
MEGYHPSRRIDSFGNEPPDEGIIVVNEHMLSFLESAYGLPRPDYLKQKPPSWKIVFEAERPGTGGLRKRFLGKKVELKGDRVTIYQTGSSQPPKKEK